MLNLGKTTLEEALREGRALGAFSVYNLEGVRAVCRAAEAEGTPVILQAGSSAFRYGGRRLLAALALAAAEASDVRVGVHLDYSRDLAEIRECLEFGYTSVMVDGSDLPHGAGAWIEAELGGLGGDEDRSGQGHAGEMTDPEFAARFVEETGVDALAVAIGNMHGFTLHAVRLDLERLAEIRELVPIPLVLHGASGLPEDQIEGVIALGVAKINVNAELRRAFIAGVKDSADRLAPDDDSIASLLSPAMERMQWAVREKIRLFSRINKTEEEVAHAPTDSENGRGAS